MNRWLPYILILCMFSVFSRGKAQDPVMANFYAGLLNLNPALAGTEGPSRISLGYRNQWPRTGTSYVTYQATFDRYIEKLHGGIGVKVMNDRQGGGVFNDYNLDFIYNYQFRATRKMTLAGGIQAGVGQRSFDGNTLVFANMIDPVSGNTLPGSENLPGYSKIFPDFATGIFGSWLNIYGGIAVHHLLRPVITDLNDVNGTVFRKYSLHAGALIPVFDKSIGHQVMLLSPNVVFAQQSLVQQVNYGLDAIYNDVQLGVWVRHDFRLNYGNLVLSAGYDAHSWRFRYSYDVRLSSPTVRLPNMNAHEFTFILIYGKRDKRKGAGAINCPKI